MPVSQSQSQHNAAAGAGYEAYGASFDESQGSDGTRPEHWTELLNALDALGADNLTQRQIKTQRILRDDGATYKPYSKQEQHWHLDAVPLLIENRVWQPIEQGLLQRTNLFNQLLKDIYGSQELIRQGVIPPEAVFAHPGFLRPCFGIPFPSDQALILHGVDMVRTGSESVCIVGDRTQAPSGAGYALENRTVMSRVFPSLFRNSYVHRLAQFFHTLRLKLNELAPTEELPNVVVLTPGSLSESYFEHAHLSNYLGYTLVQGRDLVVRNGYVWTKSLSGLTRVDVILRRVDDYFCDPVELKSDSYLGVPGLLEVIRSGRVVVANPLGSGILESPVFLKYLNDINRAFGGDDLALPSAETWWAFDPIDREYILDNLSKLLIKPVFRSHGQHGVFGGQLSVEELDQWRQRIIDEPLKFVAQRYIEPGYCPSWQSQSFTPRPVVLRGFVVAGSTSYRAMPGGLTRQGENIGDKVITNQLSSWSKDTWVLAAEPEQQITLWADASSQVNALEEQPQNLPSRVIENMFWLGRYSIRVEYALRLLRTVFIQLNNAQQLTEKSYKTILRAVTQVTETFPGFTEIDSAFFAKPEAELMSLIIDAKRPGSISAGLYEMLNCAEEVKVLLSADTQRVINDIRDNVNALEDSIRGDFSSAPEEALDPLVTSLLALSGLVHESMIRGYGWRFLEIGRNLEKVYQTTSLLSALLSPVNTEQDENSVLETVLLTLETLITYRRRYRGRPGIINGLEIAILDESNPRSLNYALQELNRHIEQLPQGAGNRFLTKACRIPLELLRKIQLADLNQLSSLDSDKQSRVHLAKLMDESKVLLNDLSTVLTEKYFDHREEHNIVTQTVWEDEV